MLGLVLAFAALASNVSCAGYLEGREYIYRYDAQIYTGFENVNPHQGGYSWHAEMIVQPRGDYAVIKFHNVELAQFGGDFENVAKHEHEYRQLTDLDETLYVPYKVYRKNGIVTSIEVPKEEHSATLNVKRGFAYIFNLNFDQFDSTDDKPDPDSHFYEIYEESMLGDCETAYVIEHHPYEKTPHNNIVLNVTKAINYHKCRSRSNKAYSVFYGDECGKAEHEKSHTLHGNAEFHYDIRGSRHDYVIEKVRSEATTSYTPYPVNGQKFITHTDRTFHLVEERPVTTPLELPDDLVSHTSRLYHFEIEKDFKDPVDLKKPHYLYKILERKAPISDIRKQVEELVQVYSDETYKENVKEKNYPAKFVELIKSVGTLGYEEISDLYKAYADIPKSEASEEQKRYRSLFFDTLVNLGTNPAVLFGTELVESERSTLQESRYFISQLQLHVKEVSEVLLNKIEQLCDHENVKRHRSLHIACVFALSNIAHDHCTADYRPEGGEIPKDKRQCRSDDAVKYFNYIARNFEQTDDEELKIAYLKAAGNVGVKEIFPYIRPYVEGAGDHHPYFRRNAIWALKNAGHKNQDKIRELLVPLLFNHSEKYELRLDAFSLLMLYRPEAYKLESIARALNREPDDQVKSYIYSYFKHLANSTHLCDRQISKDVHYAISILEEDHHEFGNYDYAYSKKYYYAGYDPQFDFGGSTTFAYLASDTGYIPRSVYLGLEDFLGGKSFQSVSMGFTQYGLEKFLDKIVGPEGTFGRRSLFDLFKKRDKRDASVAEKELNEINSKLNLPVFDYDPIHGDFFIKYMGNHKSFLHFDDRTFEDFFRDGRFSIPNLPALYEKVPEFFHQRFSLPDDKSYIIPSEAGVELIFDYKQAIYYAHHNKESSFKVEPGFFAEERGGNFPDHVKFETDGHFIIDKNLFATTYIVYPFDQSTFGAGINRRSTLSLPLKLKLNLDVKGKQLTSHWTPVAPHEIYHFKYEPYTFIDYYSNIIPQSLEKEYHPARRDHRHEVERHFFHDALGVGFDVKVDYENEFNDQGSWLDFVFEKNFRDQFYYLYANPHFEPYQINVRFNYAKEAATKEVNTVFRYKYYDQAYTNKDFSTEGFEDYARKSVDGVPQCSCAVEFEVAGHGDKERNIRGEVAWTRDLHGQFHKVNLFYNRSPFVSSENENLKVCGSSYLKYPTYDTVETDFTAFNYTYTTKGKLRLHFGKDCRSDKKIEVKALFGQTEEQHEFEKRKEEPDTPEHYNQYAYYYHECQKEQEQGKGFGKHCLEYFKLSATAHKYSFHVKYENLSPGFLNFTYKVGGFLRHLLYNHAEHNVIDVHNPDGELHLVANFSSKLPVADIRVTKPRSISEYYNVYIPQYTSFSSYSTFEDMYTRNSMSEDYCIVHGNHVKTFDNYEFITSPIDCYKVLTKDCSRKQHFAVLSKKISHPKYQQVLTVYLGKHKIEALPVSDDSDITILVDGERVAVGINEPYLYREEGRNPLFYVSLRHTFYAFHSKKYGIVIEFDGNSAFVLVSPFYRAKLCGLCGNFNKQKFDGATDSNGCYYADDSAYAYSYAVPSDTCSVPKVEPICPEGGGFGCTQLRTRVLELSKGKVPQTCFSTEPVAECSEHCKARGTTNRQISFHCLPAKDDSTKELLRQQQTRVLHEVRRKSKDHEAVVEVPDGCYRE